MPLPPAHAVVSSSMSVAQRLARLSQQYPFYSQPARSAAYRHRCLSTQASASRASDRKQPEQTPPPPTNSDQPHQEASAENAVEADGLSTPPALYAPLLGSIMKFIQRRAQQQQQQHSTAQEQHNVLTQQPATPFHSQPTAAPAPSQPQPHPHPQPQPALDLDDPAISLLFPRLPLPPPPPLRLHPPFPTPPVPHSAGRTSPAAHAVYSAWYSALPLRQQAHVLLMQAAVADGRFVGHLERVAAGRLRSDSAVWEAEMAALSRRRMSDIRKRTQREDEVLEAMWRKEKSAAEWAQITNGRNKLVMEAKGRRWQERWLEMDGKLKSHTASEHERKTWLYERNRAEAEVRAHVRLLGHSNEAATVEHRIASLLRDLRAGTANDEWQWRDKTGIKRRERELQEWKARMVRSLLAEQAQWHEEFAKQQATMAKLTARQRRQTVVATALRPIDRSNPPQTVDDLLACFLLHNSERYKLELWRHHWYINETAHRTLEQQQHANHAANNRIKQHARFMAKLKTEARLLTAVHAEHSTLERHKRHTVRSLTTTYLSPLSRPLTGWHVYQLLTMLVAQAQGRLVGVSAAVLAAQRTSEDLFSSVSLAGVVAPTPLPPSMVVTPFSWPYMLSYASSETARGGVPVVRVRYEEDAGGSGGGSGGGVVIEVRNVRRDAVVWMYEAMRDARAADGVSFGEVVRVNRTSDSADSDGAEVSGGSGGTASADGGEHGWCVLDMGDVVVQTHSEDDTSGVTARRWLSDDEVKKRLSAMPVTRFNIITAAG